MYFKYNFIRIYILMILAIIIIVIAIALHTDTYKTPELRIKIIND